MEEGELVADVTQAAPSPKPLLPGAPVGNAVPRVMNLPCWQ